MITRAITEALSTGEAVTRASREMAADDGVGEALRIVEQAEAGVSPLRPS